MPSRGGSMMGWCWLEPATGSSARLNRNRADAFASECLSLLTREDF